MGRTSAGRALDKEALRFAVIAAVRHNHTEYDELLTQGLEQAVARENVREGLETILENWRSPEE